MAARKKDKKEQTKKPAEGDAPADTSIRPIGWLPFVSAVALWASFAPVRLGYVAWIAPLGWLLAVERNEAIGKKGYFVLWLSGCLFWLAILQGIRLAYWPLYAGWIALALYLGVYIPLFVGAARILRGWKFPLMLAAPIAWVGLEMIRSYLLTGFSANMLVHTQAHSPVVIQMADHFGGYGVSFVMMAVCAAVCQCVVSSTQKQPLVQPIVSLAVAIAMMLATCGYGVWRLRQADQLAASSKPLFKVLLVQANTPTMFDTDSDGLRRAWTSYLNTTQEQAAAYGELDLVVWPESTFTAGSPWVDRSLPTTLPEELIREDFDRDYLQEWIAKSHTEFEFKVDLVLTAATSHQRTASERPFLLIGSDAMEIRSDAVRRFNSAILVGPEGEFVDRYDKVHLVMFGEYIPLGSVLQWLRDTFGISGASPGDGPDCFEVAGVKMSPSICFETTVPRLINGHVRELTRDGRSPEVLINLTNDSWFRGSSILDHHLASSIICAVENRRPILVAANSGLSAEIDGSGRVLHVIERSGVGGILAQPKADSRWGFVQSFGYPLGWLCAVIVLVAFIFAITNRRGKFGYWNHG